MRLYNADTALFISRLRKHRERTVAFSLANRIRLVHDGSMSAGFACAVPLGVDCWNCSPRETRLTNADVDDLSLGLPEDVQRALQALRCDVAGHRVTLSRIEGYFRGSTAASGGVSLVPRSRLVLNDRAPRTVAARATTVMRVRGGDRTSPPGPVRPRTTANVAPRSLTLEGDLSNEFDSDDFSAQGYDHRPRDDRQGIRRASGHSPPSPSVVAVRAHAD